MDIRPQPTAKASQSPAPTPTPQDGLATLFRRLRSARLGRLFATPQHPAKHSRAHTKRYADGRQKKGGKLYARLQRKLKARANPRRRYPRPANWNKKTRRGQRPRTWA